MKREDSFDVELPPELRAVLAGYAPDRQTIGHSDAHVFRMEAAGRPALFLKSEDDDSFPELPGEASGCAGWRARALPARASWRLLSTAAATGC